ncbi:hypothetical protein E1K68_06830 [Pseudomonas sp. B2021]|uniref:PIN domain-containing protein n=1 Tax=Pseudomonas sp. B2021 TaxID=2546445 RepID=UPI001BAF37B6|nr:PIN domain-containing protein [Pseudomonas sp. B2021]MBR7212498.1 hypothetical protein [Pseudomonas sp. B2021]
MKAAFPEHFVGEPERQKKLWADCIFVLDTNVLLDLYRFSDSARDALFKVMESLGDRLWVPYQVAYEYFENRLGVIEDQSDAYAKSISGLKAAKEKFNAGTKHPFVSDDVFRTFISSYDSMIAELESKKDIYNSFVTVDLVKERIGEVLSGRVGEPYSEEKLSELAVEGESRYLEKIPPGFQDGGKMPEATTTKFKLKKFGDLILWKQLIDHAVLKNKSVILVTGEKKDDWWLKSDKLLVTALPALSREFMSTVKQDFYLYSTDRFLLKANEYLKQDTSDNVMEEVRAINKADADKMDGLRGEFLEDSLEDSWSRIATLKGWHIKYDADILSSNADEYVRGSTSQSIANEKEVILQRAKALSSYLELYRAERGELSLAKAALTSAGVPLDDERVVVADKNLFRVDGAIDSYLHEFRLLRAKKRTLNALERKLSRDGF